MAEPFDIVIPIFARLAARDAVGPYETLQRLPDATVTFIGARTGEHRTENGFVGLEESVATYVEYGGAMHAVSVVVALIVGLACWLGPSGRSGLYSTIVGLFVLYLFNVARLTLFPFFIFSSDRQSAGDILALVNLDPTASGMTDRQLLLNVLLGVPFGVFWRTLFSAGDMRRLAVGIGLLSLVEVLQLMVSLMLGVSYRSVDLLDLIANVSGGALGGLAASLLFSLIPDSVRVRNNVRV